MSDGAGSPANPIDRIRILISEIETLLQGVERDAKAGQADLASLQKQKEALAAEMTDLQSKNADLLSKNAELQDTNDTYSAVTTQEETDDPVRKKCRIGVCEYRDRLERRVQENEKRLLSEIAKQDAFHFFLTYFEPFAKGMPGGVIGSHEAVLKDKGCFWWGKFFQRWNEETRSWDYLEPYGESIDVKKNQPLVHSIRKKVENRLLIGQPVYLYLYNPNPPTPCLHVANIQQLFCGTGNDMPVDTDSEMPACAFVPDYLLLDPTERRNRRNCQGCRLDASERCGMRFLCNFWFKVNAPEPHIGDKNGPMRRFTGPDLQRELENLIDGVTNEAINFAIPAFYPLFVFQKEPSAYFGTAAPRVTTARPTINCGAEESHTRMDKLRSLVDSMYRTCPYFTGIRINRRLHEQSSQLAVCDRDQKDPNKLTLIVPRAYRLNEDVSPAFDILLDESDPTTGKKLWIMKVLAKWCEEFR